LGVFWRSPTRTARSAVYPSAVLISSGVSVGWTMNSSTSNRLRASGSAICFVVFAQQRDPSELACCSAAGEAWWVTKESNLARSKAQGLQPRSVTRLGVTRMKLFLVAPHETAGVQSVFTLPPSLFELRRGRSGYAGHASPSALARLRHAEPKAKRGCGPATRTLLQRLMRPPWSPDLYPQILVSTLPTRRRRSRYIRADREFEGQSRPPLAFALRASARQVELYGAAAFARFATTALRVACQAVAREASEGWRRGAGLDPQR
jgi:hypothetical protein